LHHVSLFIFYAFSSTKSENRRAEQVLQWGVGVGTVGRETWQGNKEEVEYSAKMSILSGYFQVQYFQRQNQNTYIHTHIERTHWNLNPLSKCSIFIVIQVSTTPSNKSTFACLKV
jgi:hypothetical protein